MGGRRHASPFVSSPMGWAFTRRSNRRIWLSGSELFQSESRVVAARRVGRSRALVPCRAGRKALSAESPATWRNHGAQEALSPLEVRVPRLIVNGHTNNEIDTKLSVTEEAVNSQARRIPSTPGTDDRTHAAVIGLKCGIIELWGMIGITVR